MNLKIIKTIENGKINREQNKEMTGYPSIDKPWLKYYQDTFSENDIPNASIYQVALNANKDNMDSVALDVRRSTNNFQELVKITYKDLFERINESARASKTLGIKNNEIVPFILPNIPEARILVYANSMLGATSYPASPLMPNNQLEQFIRANEIKNLFIFKDFYEKYASSLQKTNLTNIIILDGSESLIASMRELKQITSQQSYTFDDKKVIPWNEYISYGNNQKEQIKPFYEDNHIAAIIGTSGTTGTPKCVCLSDKNINTVAFAYKNGKLFEGNFMDALLPSIGYGISMLHYQTVDNRYVYLIPELLTDKFPTALAQLQVDNFPGGPVHYINLLGSNEFKNGTLPPSKNLISGGASLPSHVEATLNKVSSGYTEEEINDNLIVRQGYGLSENDAMGTYSKRGAYKFGSIGIPLPYETIAIFDPETNEELKYEESGEICITGLAVMKGYLNNQEETEKVIKTHPDGQRWIHTGDIGYMDKDGHIFHVERTKNIFMRNGFNVHPSKIAEYINTIPLVKNSIVIGFEHPDEQCVPIAFIELNDEMVSDKTDEEIREHLKTLCYNNLEETSIPYEYVFVDQLPINVGGKIDQINITKNAEIDLTKHKVKKRLYLNKRSV